MEVLRLTAPLLLTTTSDICNILILAGVPGAGIVKVGTDLLAGFVGVPPLLRGSGDGMRAAVIGRLAAIEVKQGRFNRIMGRFNSMMGKLTDTVQSNFERLNWSFDQVAGQLAAMEEQLVGQQATMTQILEMTTDLRYKEGIEKIEGAFETLLKGSHNLQSTLDELKGFIFELNTENARHLSSKKIDEYLTLVQRRHGNQAAEELASYVVTVKAKYLIIVSLHYSYVEDFTRVQQEYESFNRDARAIIEYMGLQEAREKEEKTMDEVVDGEKDLDQDPEDDEDGKLSCSIHLGSTDNSVSFCQH